MHWLLLSLLFSKLGWNPAAAASSAPPGIGGLAASPILAATAMCAPFALGPIKPGNAHRQGAPRLHLKVGGVIRPLLSNDWWIPIVGLVIYGIYLIIYSIHSFIPLIVCYRAFHVHDTFVLYCFSPFAMPLLLATFFQFRVGVFSSSRGSGGKVPLHLKLGAFCQADVNPSWARAPTPISQSHLASLLCHHPDRCFVSWLLRGLDEGFPIQPGVTYGQ